MSCHRRLNLVENIDIGPFPAPKPRVVTLEPVSKRTKPTTKGKAASNDRTSDTASATSANGTVVSGDRITSSSPVPSDVSTSSRCSNSTRSVHLASDPGSSGSGAASSATAKQRMISATAEIHRSGVLPGDTLPVRVSVNHSKQIRSLYGVIVTLYRQGRIELFPTSPIGSTVDGKTPIHEDCYPRSRTGLGGLTLGSTRMSSVFRKDLSQTFAPLVLDPTTLSADVKASIRVPEDSFPTISRVPGGLISFRYYVEVVVDLRAKLTAPDRLLPRFNMTSGGKTFSTNGQVHNSLDAGSSAITANWGDSILDTDQIRRERGVVALVFEVVVGTRDSGRGQRRESSNSGLDESMAHATYPPEQMRWSGESGDDIVEEEEEEDGAQADLYNGPEDYDYAYPQQQEDWTNPPDEDEGVRGRPPDPIVPPPQLEEPANEKARLQREEQMLLPSQPPDEPDAGPSNLINNQLHVPTAPVLLEGDHVSGYQHLPGPPVGLGVSPVNPTETRTSTPPPPPPEYDKQELERRRLLMETSAPDMEYAEGEPTRTRGVHAPSAPVLDEEDEHIVGGNAQGDESLPRYLR